MLKAYEYRIYPTPQQEVQLNKTLGLCRLYYNTVVFNKKQNMKMPIEGYFQTFTKYKPEALEWVKEVDSVPLSQTWSDVTKAYNNFFKSCKKQRAGFSGEPQFKSKKCGKDGLRYSSSGFKGFVNGKLVLTRKLGPLEIRSSCRFCEGKIKNITIKKTATNKWFVKICVEKKDEPKNKNGKIVGIDWNCDDESFVTMSNGTKVKCSRFLRQSQKHLAHLQRNLERKKYALFFQKYGRMPDFKNSSDAKKFKEIPVSNNYEKQKLLVARAYEKVSWQRKDWLHKLSREICNQYETVVVEDINLQNMASNLHHGKVVGDQGFGMLRQMIAYKGHLEKVNPKNTSKMCHICRSINQEVKVGVKHWNCPVCGANHDRDINAAINILNKYASRRGEVGLGTTEITNACGEPRSSMKQESSKPSSAFAEVS